MPGESGSSLGRVVYSTFLSFRATPAVLERVGGRARLTEFDAAFRSFLDSVHRHSPSPGRTFVDGLKHVTRVEALLAAGGPVDGIVHLHRDPVDFVSSSMRNTGRGGWRGLVEHSLRYRLYHARARQAARHAPSSLEVSYERLADDIDGELARLFRFLGVTPMTVAELRRYFDREWHFMGNASSFRFDGVIPRSRHEVGEVRERWIQRIAGAGRARP